MKYISIQKTMFADPLTINNVGIKMTKFTNLIFKN